MSTLVKKNQSTHTHININHFQLGWLLRDSYDSFSNFPLNNQRLQKVICYSLVSHLHWFLSLIFVISYVELLALGAVLVKQLSYTQMPLLL